MDGIEVVHRVFTVPAGEDVILYLPPGNASGGTFDAFEKREFRVTSDRGESAQLQIEVVCRRVATAEPPAEADVLPEQPESPEKPQGS